MKKQSALSKKAYGGYASAAVRNLKKSGLTGEVLQTAIDAILGHKKFNIVKLPRKVYTNICQSLSDHKRIVVINKGPKKFTVFALDAYLNLKSSSSLNAHKHKPWNHAAKAKNQAAESSVATVVDVDHKKFVAV